MAKKKDLNFKGMTVPPVKRETTDAVDLTVNKPADTRSDRDKFVDEFTDRYQDKNPRGQADAIVWAIETMIMMAMGVDIDEQKNEGTGETV